MRRNQVIIRNRGGRHIGQIVIAAMRTVRQQEAEDASILSVCVVSRKSAVKSRGGKGAYVHQILLSSDYHARDRESSSKTHQGTRDLPLNGCTVS